MSESDTSKRGPRRLLAIGGLALLGVLVVAAVLLLVDPFGWRLLDKASGLRDEAAGAMPADTALYAEIDLLNFSEETLTEFAQPFVAALAEPGVDDLGGGLERLDAMLAEEIGLTLGDDVMPWLGRSVGLGLTELALMPDGQVDQMSWLLVAGTQDRRAADDFLGKLAQQVSERSGAQAVESDYRGRTITAFGPGDSVPLGGIAFTRSAGQVIIGSDEGTVRAAVDAQQGESLADGETFQMLQAALPQERGLTLYADQERMPELTRLAGAVAPLAVGPLDLTNMLLPPGAMGVTLADEGLRIDTVTPAGDGSEAPGERPMAGLFPAATLAYVSGDSLDGVWQSLKGSLAAGGNLADFEESMALLSREFGFDPDQQLLPLLDSEWTVAVLPAREGLVNELTGQPLGLVLLAGGDDPNGLAAAVAEVTDALEGQRLPLETAEIGGAVATFVDLESLIGAPLPLYGVDDGHLFLGTDAGNLALVLGGDGLLGEDADYRAAAALLPDGYESGAYVDLTRLLDLLGNNPEDTVSKLLRPVRSAIAGSGPVNDGVRSGVVFIVVE